MKVFIGLTLYFLSKVIVVCAKYLRESGASQNEGGTQTLARLYQRQQKRSRSSLCNTFCHRQKYVGVRCLGRPCCVINKDLVFKNLLLTLNIVSAVPVTGALLRRPCRVYRGHDLVYCFDIPVGEVSYRCKRTRRFLDVNGCVFLYMPLRRQEKFKSVSTSQTGGQTKRNNNTGNEAPAKKQQQRVSQLEQEVNNALDNRATGPYLTYLTSVQQHQVCIELCHGLGRLVRGFLKYCGARTPDIVGCHGMTTYATVGAPSNVLRLLTRRALYFMQHKRS